jgi:hypothetical protein
MVSQPIQQSAGQPLRTQDLGPLGKGQVASYQRRGSLVALAEHFEQHLGAGLGQGHEAELIDDQQFLTREILLIAQQTLVIPRLDQLMDQRRGGGEADAKSLLTSGQS